MENRMNRTVGFVLLGSFFLFVIISCSTIFGSREAKIDGFLSSVRGKPGNPDSHYLLACYYQERGRHREAIDEFQKTLLIDPGYVKAYNGMGVSYDLIGDFSRSLESYRMALMLNPDLDYVQNNMGYSYLLQGSFDKAIAAFQKAIEMNDREMRFHNNLGLAYAEMGNFDLALAHFKKGGDEAKAHYNLAQVLFKKGLFYEAREHYTKALTINPSLTIVRTGLDASQALARIFEPENKKIMAKNFIMPERPVMLQEEATKTVSTLQFSTKYPVSEQTMADIPPQGQIEGGILMEPAVVKIEEMKQPEHLKFSESTAIKSQPRDNIGNGSRIAEMLPMEKAGIEISNGNGVYQMARKVGDYLKEKGFRVTRLTNAQNFNHSDTKIFYEKEYDEVADSVAGQLPVVQGKEEKERLDRPNIKIKILIGKDLVPHHKLFENGKKS